MSRIGKQPVTIPSGVKVVFGEGKIHVEGPKGKLELVPHPAMKVEIDDKTKAVLVTRPDDERLNRSLHGLTRNLIANMVEGVTKGYEKRLKIEGVGYRASMMTYAELVEHNPRLKIRGARYQGPKNNKTQVFVLIVGYADPVPLPPPEGVTVELPDPLTIVIKGVDKQKVGQYAAEVRAVRKPEPYKGKGIRYENEQVRRKEGKSFASGG